MKPFKVIHIPYGEKNPYQKLLQSSLQRQGIKVEGKGVRRVFSILSIIISRSKPDIIHIHWQHPLLLAGNWFFSIFKSTTFIFELLVAKIMGVKIVWTVHNIVNHERRFASTELFFTKFLAKLCDKIVVHCPSAKDKIVDIFKVKESQIVIVPHGCYIGYYKNSINREKARKQLHYASDDVVFLLFGQIRLYKGIPELVDAFKKLNFPQAKLLIVGEPLDSEVAKQVLKKIQGDRRIKAIFKFVPDDEVQLYMNASDVVVLPYKDILTSGAAILAMSFSKPIIAPAIGCMPDVLSSEGGFLYNPSESDGLLNAIEQALSADLEKMGKYNFQLIKKLRWKEVAKKTYAVYLDCLGEGRNSNY